MQECLELDLEQIDQMYAALAACKDECAPTDLCSDCQGLHSSTSHSSFTALCQHAKGPNSLLCCRQIHAVFRDTFAEFVEGIQATDREYTWQLVSVALANPLLEDPENSW